MFLFVGHEIDLNVGERERWIEGEKEREKITYFNNFFLLLSGHEIDLNVGVRERWIEGEKEREKNVL